MVYDEVLAQRLREMLATQPALSEKKMFGGIAFLVRGNLCCGVLKDDLIVRVGPAAFQVASRRPHARPFDVTTRPMRGWLMLRSEGYQSEAGLAWWVRQGASFALSLPAK